MTDPVVIGMHECKWIKDANTRMFSLFAKASSGGTYDAFQELDGTDYQVPVDKKFIILNHTSTPYNTSGTVAAESTLYRHSSAGVAGGDKLQTNFGALGEGCVGIVTPLYIEVPTGEYINLKNGGSGIAYDTITGVETNA